MAQNIEGHSSLPTGQTPDLSVVDAQIAQFNERINAAAARFEGLVDQASAAIVEKTSTFTRALETPGPGGPASTLTPSQVPTTPVDPTSRPEDPEAARQLAEATCRARTRLLQSMAFDIRNPLEELQSLLAPLRGNAKIEPPQRKMLGAAESRITAILTQLDMLKDLPYIAEGTLKLDKAVFDLHRMIKESVAVLAPIAANRGIELSARIDSSTPTRVSGDPARVWQIISYVVNQAVQLAAQGQVTIHVSQKHKANDGTMLRFAVDNAGTGMAPELLDTLSEWESIGESPNDPLVHLSDGLARCSRLLSLMQGQIGIESAASRGFVIWFTAMLGQPGSVHDQRQHRRQLQEMLHCNLGPVVDLSTGGIKVLCSKLPKRRVTVIIIDSLERVKLKAEVVWSRNLGPRNFEVGLRFVSLTEDQMKQLRRITAKHGFSRAFGDD